MSYPPIADHGIIGDLHSVALVGRNGCIDRCCLPRFDSPSVFGALLDDQKGGHFSMAEVIDFMAIGRESGGETEQESRQLVRIARAIRGAARFRMVCRPALGYARAPAKIHLDRDRLGANFSSPHQQFALKANILCTPRTEQSRPSLCSPLAKSPYSYCAIAKAAPAVRSPSRLPTLPSC